MTENQAVLAVLIYDLSASGVVRNAIRIANHAAAQGMPTQLWVWRREGQFRESVPENVTIVQVGLNAGTAKYGIARRILIGFGMFGIAKLLRSRRPAVLLSAGNRCHLAAGMGYRLSGRPAHTRIIGRASNAVPVTAGNGTVGRITSAIDRTKYKELHQIVAVSHELASDLHIRLGIPENRISVIPNGIDLAAIERSASEPLDHPWFKAGEPPVIIAAGRLSRQKNHPLLIEAFALLRQQRSVRLIILGDGPAHTRQSLQMLAKKLGVAEDVRIPGYDSNPMRYFARAGVYVLSSLWEGASNSLLEALACGCPAVATDCPTGIRELLADGTIGPITPLNDASALAAAILGRLDGPRDSARLRAHAAKFDVNDSMARYFELISEVAVNRA